VAAAVNGTLVARGSVKKKANSMYIGMVTAINGSESVAAASASKMKALAWRKRNVSWCRRKIIFMAKNNGSEYQRKTNHAGVADIGGENQAAACAHGRDMVLNGKLTLAPPPLLLSAPYAALRVALALFRLALARAPRGNSGNALKMRVARRGAGAHSGVKTACCALFLVPRSMAQRARASMRTAAAARVSGAARKQTIARIAGLAPRIAPGRGRCAGVMVAAARIISA